MARAGHPSAKAALEEAEAREIDDPLTNAVRLRARAALTGDEALLREALTTFDRLECVYAAAHTRWLMGGDEREAATQAFGRLGVVTPG